MNKEERISHLNMIQQIISRMGNNSFQLKGWSVGIMIAIYAFAGNDCHKAVVVTLIPLIVFWFLDSYYLMLERKYRYLYDYVRKEEKKNFAFSMDFGDALINLNETKKYCFFNALTSKTVLPFYIVCIATTLLIYFINF